MYDTSESQTADEKKEEVEDELVEFTQPLFLQLASSLNVELVYTILKSITQFAYVNARAQGGKTKKSVSEVSIDERTGDAHLTLNQIKVKNSSSWQKETTVNASALAAKEEETLVINTSVKVTYYRMDTFMETFKDYL